MKIEKKKIVNKYETLSSNPRDKDVTKLELIVVKLNQRSSMSWVRIGGECINFILYINIISGPFKPAQPSTPL